METVLTQNLFMNVLETGLRNDLYVSRSFPLITFLFTGTVVARVYLPRELHFLHQSTAQLLLIVQNLLVIQSLPGLPVMSQVCLLSL